MDGSERAVCPSNRTFEVLKGGLPVQEPPIDDASNRTFEVLKAEVEVALGARGDDL